MREEINLNTVSITDYKIMASNLAKVVISFTGRQNKDSLREALTAKFAGKAAPVENSFSLVTASNNMGTGVGFIRSNQEIRVPTSKELKAAYRVMGSSNIMMDNRDKSLWQVKKGNGGTYLVRHAQEDLSELVEATVHRRADVPNLGNMISASAARHEFVSFVTASGDVDYGFVTAVSRNKDKMKVVSTTTRLQQIVPMEMSVGFYNVAIPRKLHAYVMAKAGLDPKQKDHEMEYWERLYFYAPAFLDEVKKNVEEGTLL